MYERSFTCMYFRESVRSRESQSDIFVILIFVILLHCPPPSFTCMYFRESVRSRYVYERSFTCMYVCPGVSQPETDEVHERYILSFLYLLHCPPSPPALFLPFCLRLPNDAYPDPYPNTNLNPNINHISTPPIVLPPSSNCSHEHHQSTPPSPLSQH